MKGNNITKTCWNQPGAGDSCDPLEPGEAGLEGAVEGAGDAGHSGQDGQERGDQPVLLGGLGRVLGRVRWQAGGTWVASVNVIAGERAVLTSQESAVQRQAIISARFLHESFVSLLDVIAQDNFSKKRER